MHSPVAIPSRDVAVHPTPAHTQNTATVTSASFISSTPSGRPSFAFAFARCWWWWASCRQTRGSLICCCHRPYAPFVHSFVCTARWLHESCLPLLHIPLYKSTSLQVYLLLLHAARLIVDLISRRDYLIYAGRCVASSRTWKRRCRCKRGVQLFYLSWELLGL